MFFDEKWREVTEEQIVKKLANKKVIIFGASQRNNELFRLISPEKIRCIYDNNAAKWGSRVDGIEIKCPHKCEGEILITVVEDYQNLVPQLRELGFHSIFYFMRNMVYESNYKAYIEFFREGPPEYVLKKNSEFFKYMHVFTDDKFFLPVVDMLEKGFNIQEHAFLVYKINLGNQNNKFGTWEKYKELSQKYHNVVLVEDGRIIPGLLNKEDGLMSSVPFIKASEKIIFHGEWMNEKIRRFFCQEDLFCEVKKKGIWRIWSGNVGKNEGTKIYIETLLKHCKVLATKRKGGAYQRLCENVDMPKHYFYDKGSIYTWLLDKPAQKKQGKKIILGQSCYTYNKNLETLRLLEKFKGSIDVYCVTSYGADDYIEEVKQEGERIFGNRFHAVDCFMPYKEYVDFLNTMDVAVYGMELAGSFNTLQILFWLKKKVYLKKGSMVDVAIKENGYYAYDYYQILDENLEQLFKDEYCEKNHETSLDEFDKEKIIERWRGLFELDMDNLP